MTQADPRRGLPSVESVVQGAERHLHNGVARGAARRVLIALARIELDTMRQTPLNAVALDELSARVGAAADLLLRGTLQRVVNATGVMLQTNLGRSPLSGAAAERVAALARGYIDLEFDLGSGRRGERGAGLSRAMQVLVGHPAVVVNNNAASLLLVLTALARAGEVIVSRGELIEIGGSFRLPDVMRLSGARLVEVGTTNRTRLADYREAITGKTAMLLKVHASNYRISGFTEQASMQKLAALARASDVLAVEDLGSGALLDTAAHGLAHEPTVQEALAAGADLVCFSADKLLGGPQAGIITGRADLVVKLARHPLYRALRPDKLTLIALETTLQSYTRGTAVADLPMWRMIAQTSAATRKRARAWAAGVAAHVDVDVVPLESTVGGGSLPEETIRGYGLAVGRTGQKPAAATIAARLRRADPAVIARVHEGRVLLDPRTVLPEEDSLVVKALAEALG
jgi:L-seryl-tRNA(Ser) seleniumtransferase